MCLVQLHGEAGKSQYEIVLGYTTCLSAADELIYTREVIKAIARKHGLLATFLPKYVFLELNQVNNHFLTRIMRERFCSNSCLKIC